MTTAFVHLWDHRVGAIAWDEATGIGYFEYDPGFLSLQLDPAPFTMPVAQARQRVFSFPDLRNKDTFKGLPGMLADVLPDKYGHAVINSWLASQGRPPDSLTPVELLCFIGKRGMGALEFEPARPKTARQSSKLEIDSLIAVAEKILTGRNNFTTHLDPDEQKALSDILKIGTSAGGARAKAVIAFNPKTLEVRSGQAQVPKGFTHWILKFDGVTDTQFGASSGYGRVEMAYYNMAKDAGIDMTECRLLEENGRAHFMTRRFDRDDQGEKIHMQSLCALRHFDFNEMNLYSYEQLFETVRMLALPYPQSEQLFRRMAFNVMGRNCDDHTKNFAFTMDRSGKWQLAPAFDVCHAYRPGSQWVSTHALSVNGKRDGIEAADLLEVARRMNIRKADQMVEEISSVVSQWKRYADEVGVETKLREAIGKTLVVY